MTKEGGEWNGANGGTAAWKFLTGAVYFCVCHCVLFFFFDNLIIMIKIK